jgi:hypothetical protein
MTVIFATQTEEGNIFVMTLFAKWVLIVEIDLLLQ